MTPEALRKYFNKKNSSEVVKGDWVIASRESIDCEEFATRVLGRTEKRGLLVARPGYTAVFIDEDSVEEVFYNHLLNVPSVQSELKDALVGLVVEDGDWLNRVLQVLSARLVDGDEELAAVIDFIDGLNEVVGVITEEWF